MRISSFDKSHGAVRCGYAKATKAYGSVQFGSAKLHRTATHRKKKTHKKKKTLVKYLSAKIGINNSR